MDDIQFINTPWVKDIIDEHIDFFLQDRWTLSNRLTLTLGARFSYQNVFYNDATNNPELTEFFTPRDLPGETLQTWFNVAPRLGAAFDLTGTGRTVAKAYFGRFYVNLADTLRGAHPLTNGLRFFDFLDPNENGHYDGPEELGQLFFASDPEPNIVNELDHSYADELSFSLEHELDRDSAVRFSYVHKTLRNDFGFWDPAQGIPLLEAGVPCGDEIFSCPPHPFTSETLPLMRLPEPFFDVQDWRVENFPDSDYSYDTVQLVYSIRPTRRIWVRANFDYQWRDELKRNIVTGSPLVSDPIGIAYFQNHHAEVGNRQTSTNWQLRLLGQVRLPSEAAVSVNFRHQSGWPWAPIHGESIPGSGFQTFFLEDVDKNRSENVYLLDVRAEKSFLVGERHRVSAMVDVFNLLNSNAETNFVHRTGGRFLDLIAALDPITMKIGVRYQF